MAATELGLVDDSISSNLELLADRFLQIGATSDTLSEAITTPKLTSDLEFTVKLTQGSVNTGDLTIITRAADGALLGFGTNQAGRAP